ncbi:FadR/GntR family transcriptional regulator [Rhodovibrionaceae bacterium A322]
MSQDEVKRILSELLPFIRYHRLNPGDRLPSERDLSSRFNASRNSIREALTALESMRVVERRPNSGIYLQAMTKDTSVDAIVMFEEAGVPVLEEEIADYLETRRILEMEAFRLACDRRTDEDLENLQKVLDDCLEEIGKGKTIALLDVTFHLTLVEAAHNQVYRRLVNSFYLATRKGREVFFDNPGQSERSHQDHLKLFNALRDRDVEGGLQALEEHLSTVESYWSRVKNRPAEKVSAD